MDQHQSHPTSEDLITYSQGGISSNELSQHLEACQECRASVDDLAYLSLRTEPVFGAIEEASPLEIPGALSTRFKEITNRSLSPERTNAVYGRRVFFSLAALFLVTLTTWILLSSDTDTSSEHMSIRALFDEDPTARRGEDARYLGLEILVDHAVHMTVIAYERPDNVRILWSSEDIESMGYSMPIEKGKYRIPKDPLEDYEILSPQDFLIVASRTTPIAAQESNQLMAQLEELVAKEEPCSVDELLSIVRTVFETAHAVALD